MGTPGKFYKRNSKQATTSKKGLYLIEYLNYLK
jgi:hypothetical protein